MGFIANTWNDFDYEKVSDCVIAPLVGGINLSE